MFTEFEVQRLKTLSDVSRPSIVDESIYNASQCQLDPGELKAHYNSYLAGSISVYNPVSIMSAFMHSKIENYWVNTGLLVMNFILRPTEFCCRPIPSITQEYSRGYRFPGGP